MKRDNDRQTAIILSIVGIVPVIWLALLIAPSISGGLPEIAANLATLFDNPFSIKLCGDSLKTVLILLLCYGMGIGIYFSTRKNYRRREEHGSAKWGNVRAIDKKYRQKPLSENKLMTQNVCIGLNAKKHRRNLNTLVCGGSGAGKTRFYAKPNIMNAARNSYVILDPKGEILRDTGHLLEKKGYEVRVLDLISMEKSHCYNPFVYLQNDNDVQKLVTNLFKSTTPKGSQSNDPFWDIYYGQNVISKNMIIADRKQLLNGNSFILGVSGGGKSFAAKGEIINQVLSSDADIIIIDPEREYSQLVNAMGGEVINISATSDNHINAMDMNKDYGDGANPVILKSEFIMSLCEQLIGGTNLGAKQKSIIDRCTASVYRSYQQNDYQGHIPTLQDFRAELLQQDEPEAKELALAIELFTHGSLNTFAKQTNVDTNNRLICYDILDLGKQLMPIGMLVVLDSILNRITQNRAKGKNTFIFIDEIYLLFQHEYSANFLFTLWKRVRKYGAYASGITQNVDDLLQSHTARTMLANSEFIIMLNQASTDRLELAKLLNISDLQMSYITNVEAGHGLIKVGSSLVPFANKFPKNTKLYKLMTTKPGEVSART